MFARVFAKVFQLLKRANTKCFCQKQKEPVYTPFLGVNNWLCVVTLVTNAACQELRTCPEPRGSVMHAVSICQKVCAQTIER